MAMDPVWNGAPPGPGNLSDNAGARCAYTNLASALGGGAQSLGVLQDWIAPVGVFDAPQGFGEECWMESSPVTVIASRLHGANVNWHCGPAAGRVSGPSCIALQPRAAPNFATANGPIRFAQTYLPDVLIDRVADAIKPGTRASGIMRDDLVFVSDRELETMTQMHVRAALTGASALELEASAILLIGTVLRRYHGFAEPRPARGGLAPWQLKRACDAMDAHLDKDIGLDMLSAIAGCSPTHFSRAFKQSTGLPRSNGCWNAGSPMPRPCWPTRAWGLPKWRCQWDFRPNPNSPPRFAAPPVPHPAHGAASARFDGPQANEFTTARLGERKIKRV